MMRGCTVAVLWAIAQSTCVPVRAQSMQNSELGTGKILVASRDLPDPNFAKAVVLLVKYDDEGVVGLILNRRSDVPISRVLDDMNGAKGRSDPVYAGGPVGRSEVLALLRAHTKPEDSTSVFSDIYLVSSKETLEKSFAEEAGSNKLHVYLGYAGWTEGQLEHEVDLKAWYIFRPDSSAVFDSDPDSLWTRLIRQTDVNIASTPLPGWVNGDCAACPPFLLPH
jgi:putative transcriptional regulator